MVAYDLGSHQKHKHSRFRMQNKHRTFFVSCTVQRPHQYMAVRDWCIFFYSDKKKIYATFHNCWDNDALIKFINGGYNSVYSRILDDLINAY